MPASVPELLQDILDAINALGPIVYTMSGTEGIVITDVSTPIRGAVPASLKVVITNTGDNPVSIYESGKLVSELYTDESYVSDLQGLLAFTGKCETGLESEVAVTTYYNPV